MNLGNLIPETHIIGNWDTLQDTFNPFANTGEPTTTPTSTLTPEQEQLLADYLSQYL